MPTHTQGPRTGGRGGPPDDRDADAEFLEGALNDAGPATLDFDDEASSRDLHEREPEDDFAAYDGRPVLRDAADVADVADLASLFDDGDDTSYDDDDAFLH